MANTITILFFDRLEHLLKFMYINQAIKNYFSLPFNLQRKLPKYTTILHDNQGVKHKFVLLMTAEVLCEIVHRVLVKMEGTAHIDFPKFKTAKAINFKILPAMHM